MGEIAACMGRKSTGNVDYELDSDVTSDMGWGGVKRRCLTDNVGDALIAQEPVGDE